jgi:hypothetical protein
MHWIDPEFLPEIEGTLERFTLNPKGEIDGLVLTDDTLVHVPPHLGHAVEELLQPGKTVRVRGVRPRDAVMVATVWIANADGRSIIDNGPDERNKDAASGHVKPRPTEAVGTVRLSLYAPKGELRGALLAEGTIVRVRPKQAQQFERLLRPQAALAVRGDGLETRLGRVVDAKEIGELTSLTPVKETEANKEKPASPAQRDRRTLPKTAGT